MRKFFHICPKMTNFAQKYVIYARQFNIKCSTLILNIQYLL